MNSETAELFAPEVRGHGAWEPIHGLGQAVTREDGLRIIREFKRSMERDAHAMGYRISKHYPTRLRPLR